MLQDCEPHCETIIFGAPEALELHLEAVGKVRSGRCFQFSAGQPLMQTVLPRKEATSRLGCNFAEFRSHVGGPLGG